MKTSWWNGWSSAMGALALASASIACGNSESNSSQTNGGTAGTGGHSGAGGLGGTGHHGGSGSLAAGAAGVGDEAGAGGMGIAPANGGETSAGGETSLGGTTSMGGVASTGGLASTGGVTAAGGAAGAPAEGGIGGESGGGGASGGAVPETPLHCDDHNACTHDSVADGACKHEAEPNGTPCDDQNFCTLGDECRDGVCTSGTPQASRASVLGTLESYGTGSVQSFGDDRLFFVDRALFAESRLSVAKVENGVVHRLASLDVNGLPSTWISTAWGGLAAVTEGSTSVLIGGDPRLITLFSTDESGALTRRGAVALMDGASPAMTSMLGRGNKLLVCANFGFFSAPIGTVYVIDVTDADSPVVVTHGAVNGSCGSLALSEDGQRLYANTANGVQFMDFSKWDGSATFTFDNQLFVPENSGLSLKGSRLLVRSGDLVRVFDESSRALLSSFNVAGARSSAWTDAGVFTQGIRWDGKQTEVFVALHDTAGTLIDERTIARLDYQADLTTRAVAAPELAVSPYGGPIWKVSSGGFQPLQQPEMAVLDSVHAQGNILHTRGRTLWGRVDVSDPTRPAWQASGPHQNPHLSFKLDHSLSPAALVSEFDAALFDGATRRLVVQSGYGHSTTLSVEGVSADENEHSIPDQSFTLPGGIASLASFGDSIYRAVSTTTSATFQRFRIVDLEAGIAAPTFELTFTQPTSVQTFDVDPIAQRALFAFGGYDSNSATFGKLVVIDLSTDPPSTIESADIHELPYDALLRGDHLVYTDGTTLAFRQVLGSEERRITIESPGVDQLLAFDGNVVYFSARKRLAAASRASETLLLDVPTRNTMLSLVETPKALVAAGGNELITLSPACQP